MKITNCLAVFWRKGCKGFILGAWLSLVGLGLSACASKPALVPQALLRDAASLGLSEASASAAAPQVPWWRELGDKQLAGLIDQALESNPSLRIAQTRIARAQAGAMALGAASGPQINASIDATHQRFTANGMIPPPLAGAVYDTATAQVSGSWELDFFGKNRAALQAALGQVRAAQADAEAARTLLASTLARTYFQWTRLHAQRALAQRLLAQRTQVLQLVRARLGAGLDTQLELRLSEGTLPEARLQIETLQEQMTLALHAMAALIGQPNLALALAVPAQAAINSVVPLSVPADLLGRRADIAAARWRVAAASQDVANANSQFYPNVNLVAFAGFSSIGLGHLLSAGSQQWGVEPALRLPLFDGGRLRANLSGKAADLDAAIESYNSVVIEAVREVADQITSAQAIARQQVEQHAAQEASERAYTIAQRRYAAGLGNLLSVLAAEAAVLNQRRLGVDLYARSRDTQVALLRALGGAYRAELPAATAQK